MIYIEQHAIVWYSVIWFRSYIFYQFITIGGIKNLAQAMKDSSRIGQQEKQYSSFNIWNHM